MSNRQPVSTTEACKPGECPCNSLNIFGRHDPKCPLCHGTGRIGGETR